MNELNSQTLLEISKKLEIDNFNLLNEVPEGSLFKEDYKSWVVNENVQDKNIDKDILQHEEDTGSFKDKEKTQFRSFQKAMKVVLAIGQCLGLNPVSAIFDNNISNIRFTVCSWVFLYTILIATAQTLITGFCLQKAFNSAVISIHAIAFVTFCVTTSATTFLFIRIATKWENLLKEIFNCNLDKYVDPDIIIRCNATCIIFMLFSILHCLFEIMRDAAEVLDCFTGDYNFFEKMMSNAFPWLQHLNQPYNLTMAIIVQIILIMMSATYNYLDIFIICTSLYLASVLKQINKKILWAADKIYLLPSIWGTLREEYSRATRLVRLFDDVFSGLILISFAMNLFLICLHLFNILSNGVRPRIINSGACPNYPRGLFEIMRDAAEVLDCFTGDYNFFEKMMSNAFPWLQHLNQPYNLTMAIIVQIILIMMSATYNYLDIFIICTSLYLASVLKQINKKILWAADKIYLLPSIWGTLREEYSRATRLVRLFDDVFSGLILISFAMNLFLICLHLFNILSNGVRPRIINSGACPNYPRGILYGYEYAVYVIYTLIYLTIRFLTVSLVAASVNDASLVPVSALYKVPSCSYSTEVQRFLDQVHDDVVALSGMEYFYITKGLVLSVVGTILTYELVLLQFNIEESNMV